MSDLISYTDLERLPPGDLVPYGRSSRKHMAVLEESEERFDDLTAKRKAAQSEQG